jgi:hypothetical protein
MHSLAVAVLVLSFASIFLVRKYQPVKPSYSALSVKQAAQTRQDTSVKFCQNPSIDSLIVRRRHKNPVLFNYFAFI